jgi:hypothetical protein
MPHKYPFKRRKLLEVYELPPCATDVVAEALRISSADARKALIALLKAGFFIGPREPTNAMLVAYMNAVFPAPSNPSTSVQSIAKARKRWKAMSEAGTKLALSRLNSERGGKVDATDLKSAGPDHAGSSPAARTNGATHRRAGGLARAAKLSAQRRSEIAKIAATARWARESVQ